MFLKRRDPVRALGYIGRQRRKAVYLLTDFRQYLEQPTIVRMLREMVMEGRTVRSLLVLTSPQLAVPAELEAACAFFEWPESEGGDLGAIFEEVRANIAASTGREIHIGAEARDALLEKVKEMPPERARFEVARALLAGGSSGT